jgi:YbgC/YbaW family acyl-CoA thioester hydrolase
MQRIVFNGHYLMYFDTAVAGYWRALAMPYHETMVAVQGDLFVRKATLEYEASARYDEQLAVGIRCARIGNSSLVFEAAVFRGEQRLVHGELVYVFADPATQTSKPVPTSLREWFQAYEAGERMFDVQVGGWAALGAGARAIRRRCTPWRATGSGWRWPRGGCCRHATASARSAAWRP